MIEDRALQIWAKQRCRVMKSILIVEDNEPMRQMIRALVRDLAANIYDCSDGALALATYSKKQPDWVLMDIEMPLLDGLAATRQIKKAFPNANIMIVSNYGDERIRAAAAQAGAAHFVLKENLSNCAEYLAHKFQRMERDRGTRIRRTCYRARPARASR